MFNHLGGNIGDPPADAISGAAMSVNQGAPYYTEQSFSESGFQGSYTEAEGVGPAGGFFYSMNGKVFKDGEQWYVYVSSSAWAPAAENKADAITYSASITVLENGKPIVRGVLRVWDPNVTRIGQGDFTYIGNGSMRLPATGNNVSVKIKITYNMYQVWNGHAFPWTPYVYTIKF